MLGKLLKYEMKAFWRIFLPIWGGILAISAALGVSINASVSAADGSMLNIILTVLLVVLMIAMGLIALILILQRFYKGLLGQEGYLMFTLPVRSHTLITAKGISAMLLMIISTAVALLAALFIAAPTCLIQNFVRTNAWLEFRQMLQFMREIAGPGAWAGLIVSCIILILVSLLATIYQFYAAMAVGHLFKRHRLAWSFLAYVVITIILTVISTHLMFFSGFRWDMPVETFGMVIACVWVCILANAIPLAIFDVASTQILKRRLNLE